MKKYLSATFPIMLAAMIALAWCGAVWAQSDKTPADEQAAQATKPKIRLTPSVIRAAQQKLDDAGYQSGRPDGKMGPKTRAAIRKYQQDQNLVSTGTLDESTLSKLDVGGNQTMATAPGDIKSGAKAAGHDIKEKHPVAAAKDLGKGIGQAGKAVGEGAKSDVVNAKDKTKAKVEQKKAKHDKSDEDKGTPK